MKRLSGECKQLIVQSLACFIAPSEVVAAVKLQFGIELTRQQVAFYDPTKGAGAERLSQTLRDLFAATRERFISSVDDVGIAHLRYRLERLQEVCDRAEARGNDFLLLKVLEQAAKEVGGWYDRRGVDGRREQRQATARLLAQSPGAVDLKEWKRRNRAA